MQPDWGTRLFNLELQFQVQTQQFMQVQEQMMRQLQEQLHQQQLQQQEQLQQQLEAHSQQLLSRMSQPRTARQRRSAERDGRRERKERARGSASHSPVPSHGPAEEFPDAGVQNQASEASDGSWLMPGVPSVLGELPTTVQPLGGLRAALTESKPGCDEVAEGAQRLEQAQAPTSHSQSPTRAAAAVQLPEVAVHQERGYRVPHCYFAVQVSVGLQRAFHFEVVYLEQKREAQLHRHVCAINQTRLN